MAQCLQRQQVIFPVDSRDDDATESFRTEYAIHSEPGRAAIAIEKGMDLRDHEHRHDGSRQWMNQGFHARKPFAQCARHELWHDEERAARLIRLVLPFAGLLVDALLHDQRVDAAQPDEEIVRFPWRLITPGSQRSGIERAEDVMRVV